MATLDDIARELGISKSTVSKALNGAASTITQEQIDYVYNGAKAPTMGDGE